MRFDAIGLFWEDLPPEKKAKKEKVKSIPPEPIWLLATYLPGLEEARAMTLDLLSDDGLVEAWRAGERFTFDIESYPNWWYLAFKSKTSGKFIIFELIGEDAKLSELDQKKLAWILTHLTTIGFNTKGYDLPEAAIAAAGYTCLDLYKATQLLIEKDATGRAMRPHDVLKRFRIKKLEADNIDVMAIPKGKLSLKIYAGRLHAPRMQDLPFEPGTILTEDQITIGRWYCCNDLDNTELLYDAVLPQIELREKIGARYGIDVRSRSDAQIAEDLLGAQIKKRTGMKFLPRTNVKPGTILSYNVPHFIKFKTELLNWVLDRVRNSAFEITPGGKVKMPEELGKKKLKININQSTYHMGIGGLHSFEKNVGYKADETWFLKDRDVTSYYPRIILNLDLKPENLGQNFTIEYTTVVNDRVTAKARGDNLTADTYKIVANGSFGKFGDKWSILYSPQLLIQTTITGQLSLLMLIERLELAGFSVVSANTDGIVTRGMREREDEFKAIMAEWEKDTGFLTEEKEYAGLYSRDVNNYLAVFTKPDKDGKQHKGKGIFGDIPLDKNPVTRICYLSAIDHIIHGVDYKQSILNCHDLTKFTSMQRVRGGAYKDGVYLGKAIRWYYATGVEGCIVNAKNGNRIPLTEGARPCMTLPKTLPEDLDYDWYILKTQKLLQQIGFAAKEETELDEDDEDLDEDDDEIIIED